VAIQQQIQWVVLPAGLGTTPDRLRLSVFVAPRLRTDEGTTLAPFADFLDWPAVISAASTSFEVELPDGTGVPATVVGPVPDSSLWTSLFSGDTPLQPFVFDDHADRPMVSFSSSEVVGFLRRAYATLAASSPDELPPLFTKANAEPRAPGLTEVFQPLQDIFRGTLFEGIEDHDDLDGRIGARLDAARDAARLRREDHAPRGGSVIEPLKSNGSVSREFERVMLFHRRPQVDVDFAPDEAAARKQFGDQVDFHQMLAALGDHPALLRRLGLVVDLEVSRDAIPTTGPVGDDLRLRPTWNSARAPDSPTIVLPDLLPATVSVHLEVDPDVFFAAAPRTPNPMAPAMAPPIPLLAMPPAAFGLEQVDTDGAALKALGMAATLQTAAANPAPAQRPLGEPAGAGTPSLRTSGLTLVETGRAAGLQSDFAQSLVHNDALESGGSTRLHAEDLVRGYRLDVLDTVTGTWRSLHERVVTYVAPNHQIGPLTDEGFFQITLASAPTPPGTAPDHSDPVYIHESLVTWDGWSLSVPRPGKAISRDSRAPTPGEPDTQPQRIENRAMTALDLAIDATIAPGTLPRLRFGNGYRVRARTVDLAGNGPTLAEADHLVALAVTDTPIIPAVGDQTYRRFEPVAAPVLVPRERFGDGASLLRLVIRSDAGQTAEEYASAFNQSEIVTAGTHLPLPPADDRHVAPPKAALQQVEAHGMLDNAVGSDGQVPDAGRHAEIRAVYEVARREKGSIEDPTLATVELVDVSPDPQRPQRYAVHHEDRLALPYLPDPWAVGAIFFGLPGVPPKEPFVVNYDAPAWFQAQPFLFRLADGQGAPVWDGPTRVLTVNMAQATTATVRVASFFGGDLRTMGLVDWWERELGPADFDTAMTAADANRHWMITPWHEVTLVHAVQHPLEAPVIEELTPGRVKGSLRADFFGLAKIDGASTAKVDLMAEWDEWVDDLASDGPGVRSNEQVVFSLPVSTARLGRTDVDPHEVGASLRHEHLLSFSTKPGLLPPTGPLAHTFRDTKYRAVRYRLVAASPFREYFPQQWADDPELLSRTSDVQSVDILSTARPSVPHVQYVVPTQGWEAGGGGADPVVRVRRGGGLRVYLDRPWYSSGDGELLGVVIGPPLTSPKAVEYPLVTLLGQDPIHSGAPVELATASSFPGATVVARQVRFPELANTSVDIAGFVPLYDTSTKRWFADIDVATPDAYFPFVRLALVRYQPNALVGLQLSQVVLADIAQTLPDRTLTVTRAAGDGAITVTVSGPTYQSIADTLAVRSDEAALSRVSARFEAKDPAVVDPTLAWQPVEGSEVVLTRSVNGVLTTWTGTVAPGPQGVTGLRLVVKEQEQIASDEQVAGPGGLVGRIVYADAVDLA